jgi:AhpD family alkylhydroperoxidase
MTTMKNLERLPSLNALAPQSAKAFWAFDEAALAEGAIPWKYKELMAVSVALTTQCAYCIEIHRDRAIRAGATHQELSEAVFVTAALRAGAAVTHGTHLLSGIDDESRDLAEATLAAR